MLLRSQYFEIRLKSNLHYTRSITPKHVTSGGTHLHDLAPEQRSVPKKRPSAGESLATLSHLTDLGFEPQTSRTDSFVLTTEPTYR